MRKENIYKYAIIGGWTTWFGQATVNFTLRGEKGIITAIERFISTLEELNLHVSYRASADLIKFKKEIEKSSKTKLTQKDCNELSQIAKILLPTLQAEIKGYEVFIITDKRYSIEKLTEKIDQLFSPGVYGYLSDIAQYDISESGKCILYETPTAAAFHILRATESILKKYYKKFLRRSHQGKTWGQLLNELRNKQRGKLPNTITLNQLWHIKDSFRNPTNHPEKTYDINEVQDLFNLCIDVINRMVNDIR